MRVLLSWLREFAPIEGDPSAVGDVMDDLGMAVEELVPLSFDGVVVARVLELRPHPSADRIQLVDVDAGDGDSPAIVRGRKVGDVAAVAVALIADAPPVAAPF